MSQLNPLKNILSAIRLEEPERVPIATLEQEHAVKLAGIKYSEYATDATKIVKTQLHTIKKYSLDFAWIHIDDLLEYEVMGNKLRFFDKIVPTTDEYAVNTEEDVDRLEIPDPEKDGRLPILLSAIEELSRQVGDEIFICGRVASAFTGMLLLRGLERGLKDLYVNRKLVDNLLRKAHEVAKIVAEAQMDAGAHGLWVGDCLATSRIIPPRFQDELVLPYQRELNKAIRRHGGFSLLFSDEKNIDRLCKEGDSDPDVMGIGTGVSLGLAKAKLGDDMCIYGNIDPVHVLLEGSTSDVDRAVRECIDSAASGGGYIFASGEAICRETPEANLHKMVKTATIYGRYSIQRV